MDIDKINALYYQSKNKLLKENAPVASAPQEYVVHYKTQQGTDAKNTVSLNQLSDRIKNFLQKGLTITGVGLAQQSEDDEKKKGDKGDKAKDQSVTDREHDEKHDTSFLNLPSPGSREDRESLGYY